MDHLPENECSFPTNDSLSDDDFDESDVVLRHGRGCSATRLLLEDGGDGADADLLGTTPPRARIRNKEKRRSIIMVETSGRMLKDNRRNTIDQYIGSPLSDTPDRLKKRLSLKINRTRERDIKMFPERDSRSDSIPSPGARASMPTLVESCSRFMSLTSRLKCSASPDREPEGGDAAPVLPRSRVDFHNTFSLLINMGNLEKGCRRTLSREEQVWQNELKDLIWLELLARIAGRSLAEQDAFICAQRRNVCALIDSIINYRFQDQTRCTNANLNGIVENHHCDDAATAGCLAFNCESCSTRIGAALKETRGLLDSLDAARALYPSFCALSNDARSASTKLFDDKLKALCLWYNITNHLRMKLLLLRRMVRAVRAREAVRKKQQQCSDDSDEQECTKERQCTVRFNCEVSDTGGTESSAYSNDSEVTSGVGEERETEDDVTPGESRDEHDSGLGSKQSADDVDCHVTEEDTNPWLSEPMKSVDSGYSSELGSYINLKADVFELGSLHELTLLRLLDKCDVSPYRYYLHDILKTQGVRNSTLFIDKMQKHVLDKTHLTLESPDVVEPVVFTDNNGNDKTEMQTEREINDHYELRRYGWWSPERISMCLPSYRGHFLLLSTVCMEVVADHLRLRLGAAPPEPSCFTLSQINHELREGLDIASEVRGAFTRNVRAALRGVPTGLTDRNTDEGTDSESDGKIGGTAAGGKHADLLRVAANFDNIVRDALKQYLSYMVLRSKEKVLSRAQWESEWSFTASLARRFPKVRQLVIDTHGEVMCNQLDLLKEQFEYKFKELTQYEVPPEDDEEALRQYIFEICRLAQGICSSQREETLQGVQCARLLAQRLARASRPRPARLYTSLMSLRSCISAHTASVLELSRDTSLPASAVATAAVQARPRELLLQLFHLAFEVHRELHRFVGECRPSPRLVRTDSVLDDDDRLIRYYNQSQSSIELLLSGETDQPLNPDPSAVDTISEAEEQFAVDVARAIIDFAKWWMRFAIERCERGRGLRPRWASQGLEFLMLACDPHNTMHLTDEEFEELKQQMDGCISHVIGSRAAAPPAPASPVPPNSTRRHKLSSPLSLTSSCSNSSAGNKSPSPNVTQLSNEQISEHSRRVSAACAKLDARREAALRAAGGCGRVSAIAPHDPPPRQLSFRWQRGLKIGQGTFGKVYTVINTETGQLLAMKEIAINPGDRRSLQRAANELRLLETTVHPHLVRYYGCELHREKMLLFMELCVEGSLEALVATAGALPETTIRRYTRQLVDAVVALHQRHIAHRDIKSGNIFLTNEGHCLKLGDFGSAVRLRASHTAVGELQGAVGTQAYMAPEVFMNPGGHGRAADIWSLGCVVTEMASGKRPFSEYDNNYQIMFVVGMGGAPALADTLSHEGAAFCHDCLLHRAAERPTALQLLEHPFLNMSKSDEDCQCEPGFLKPKSSK